MKNLTKAEALKLGYRDELIHESQNNADGTPVRARVNGKVKTWKIRENDYLIPVKHGLKECFYIGRIEDWKNEPRNFSPEQYWRVPENGEQYEKRV